MAKAKRIKNTPPPPPPVPDTINVELSLREAVGLKTLLGRGISLQVLRVLDLESLSDELGKTSISSDFRIRFRECSQLVGY
jgi:hypothetical protein